MYTSPFDPERFPAAPVPDVPVNMSPEGAKVLERLRSALPDPLDWNAASPIEMSTALARAIFDHEAARLTLDLPDDRMDLPVALHMDDPRLMHLLDTARHMHRHDPSAWPTLMDMALEAVQAETANVMSLDVEGLDARDLDNQNMPLYETIHEDMLDHRLETRYQGILNPGTLTAPPVHSVDAAAARNLSRRPAGPSIPHAVGRINGTPNSSRTAATTTAITKE